MTFNNLDSTFISAIEKDFFENYQPINELEYM